MRRNEGLLEGLEVSAWAARELPVKLLGDEALKAMCETVGQNEFGTPEVTQIANEMVKTLARYRERTGMGRGLAANQIGHTKRTAVLWVDDSPLIPCNPQVTGSEGRGSYWESCISGGKLLVGEVFRLWTANFHYQDIDGKVHELAADEKQTRVLLHEIDHLGGISCSEKYEPDTMRIVTGDKEE